MYHSPSQFSRSTECRQLKRRHALAFCRLANIFGWCGVVRFRGSYCAGVVLQQLYAGGAAMLSESRERVRPRYWFRLGRRSSQETTAALPSRSAAPAFAACGSSPISSVLKSSGKPMRRTSGHSAATGSSAVISPCFSRGHEPILRHSAHCCWPILWLRRRPVDKRRASYGIQTCCVGSLCHARAGGCCGASRSAGRSETLRVLLVIAGRFSEGGAVDGRSGQHRWRP